MANDGRTNNGGARRGAGRKSKAVEDDLQKLLKKCVTKQDREAIFMKWKEDAQSTAFSTRARSRETLAAYMYGKPVDRHEVSGPDGGPVETVGRTLDEWRKRSAERSTQAAEAMADFEGEDA